MSHWILYDKWKMAIINLTEVFRLWTQPVIVWFDECDAWFYNHASSNIKLYLAWMKMQWKLSKVVYKLFIQKFTIELETKSYVQQYKRWIKMLHNHCSINQIIANNSVFENNSISTYWENGFLLSASHSNFITPPNKIGSFSTTMSR